MICPICKTSNINEARFCLSCGEALPNSNLAAAPQINAALSGVVNVPIPAALDDEITRVVPALVQGVSNAGRANGDDVMLGRTIEGKYQLIAKLGQGGMGAVYKAERLLIGDHVAVKILHAEHVAQPQSFERFRREAQAAARLKHPNAVSIYDFGATSDGLVYLVMELVEGQSLRQIIKHQGPLTPTAAAEIITQVCFALDEAHRQQIVHRDLKPDNIIVDATLNGLRTKVLDFGIAKLRDLTAGNLTQTGSVMGTPHYMSPEQCLGEELDNRSDIYSLGIVLYEMLTGIVPFNAPISTAVVVQHVNQKPPSLRAINVSISEELERVVLHALEKKREARPQTATLLSGEFADALRSAEAVVGNRSPFQISVPDLGATLVMTAPASAASATGTMQEIESTRNSSKIRFSFLPILILVLVLVTAVIAVITLRNNDAGIGRSSSSIDVSANDAGNRPEQLGQAFPQTNVIGEGEVRQFLQDWKMAWERKDLKAYASFYDEKFIGRNYSSRAGHISMTRDQWLKDKEQKFRYSPLLLVTIGEPTIKPQGDGVSVVFQQEFRSSRYADRGVKTLRLRRTADGLRIVNEDFVPRQAAL